jgi:hypothetical protein
VKIKKLNLHKVAGKITLTMRELLMYVAPQHETDGHSIRSADIGTTMLAVQCSCGLWCKLFDVNVVDDMDLDDYKNWSLFKERVKCFVPWK